MNQIRKFGMPSVVVVSLVLLVINYDQTGRLTVAVEPVVNQTKYMLNNMTDFLKNPLNREYCNVSDERVDITDFGIVQKDEVLRIGKNRYSYREITAEFKMEPEETYCIPKSLHFIWLGQLIPEKYQKNILTFRPNNPEYEINLWTEVITDELRANMTSVNVRDIMPEIARYITKPLFDKATNVGAKSDILRYEIVYQNGGTYADTDSLSVLPFNDLLTHSWVTNSLEPWHAVSNAFFGFPKYSKFLEYVFRALKWNMRNGMSKDADGNEYDIPNTTGPGFLTGCFMKYNDTKINIMNAKYTTFLCNESIAYQTLDASWIGRK